MKKLTAKTVLLVLLVLVDLLYQRRFYSLDRRDVPVGVPLDLSTPTGMSCIGTYGENYKSDNVVAFLLLWHEN